MSCKSQNRGAPFRDCPLKKRHCAPSSAVAPALCSESYSTRYGKPQAPACSGVVGGSVIEHYQKSIEGDTICSRHNRKSNVVAKNKGRNDFLRSTPQHKYTDDSLDRFVKTAYMLRIPIPVPLRSRGGVHGRNETPLDSVRLVYAAPTKGLLSAQRPAASGHPQKAEAE